MKRIWLILLLALLLTGCKTIADFKPDTIVDIPLHPTEDQSEAAAEMTEPLTEMTTETEPVTEATEPTEAQTQPPRNSGSSGGSSSGGKKPGKGSSNSKPPATEPVTQPPTQPPTAPPTEPPTETPTAPLAYDPSGYAPKNLDRAVADAVNAKRQEAGLMPLSLDSRLCAIASVRVHEIMQLWSQTRPDGSAGISVLAEYGYGYGCAGENLYFGVAGAGTIVDKWMASEARKNNILMESAAAIGVGSFTDTDGITYVAALIVG